MKISFSYFSRRFILVALAFALEVSASTDCVRLSGHIPSKPVENATFLKELDPETLVSLTLVLPLRNREALEAFVERIYDPSAELYGKYLTSEEFIRDFAPTQDDYNHVAGFAITSGLPVVQTHSNRMLLNILASKELVEKVFNLNLHQYQKSDGKIFYAPNNDPEVPNVIASMIEGVVGLDNHSVWGTYHRKNKKEVVNGSDKHPSGPSGGYSPKDILTAYNLTNMSAKGSGQVIALFELGGYQASDIEEYARYFGLPSPKLTNVLVDGGSSSGINPEVTLDIELALALAPESEIYVYEGPNSNQGVLNTYNRIATDNIAKQVSTSWGLGENLVNPQYLKAENAIFLQMAAQGQTIYAAAGDSGAYDDYPNRTLAVDDPASQPYVVGVGGTKLTVDPASGAYAKETVWNEGLGQGAGGGGVSQVWPIPAWQKHVSSAFSKTHRNVPDVALNADPATGYSIYYDGKWTTFGGTSCAAPLWAAFTACINQERVANEKPVLGFINPLLYKIGTGSSYKFNFHDVLSGDNLHYSAKSGYDNASGWGSFKGAHLFQTLTDSVSESDLVPH